MSSTPRADDSVPEERVRVIGDRAERPTACYVLYWMIATRRTRSNFALQRAAQRARALDLPLLVLEALRCDYPFASDRLHRFVLQGMAANQSALEHTGALYYPYVESAPNTGRGLLQALASRAALVVTDDYPAFFLPRMVAAAGRRLDVKLEAVDSNGLLPIYSSNRAHPTAYGFRRHLQSTLPRFIDTTPASNPLAGLRPATNTLLPPSIENRWPRASLQLLSDPEMLRSLPIDHGVGALSTPGGSAAGSALLARFVAHGLARYERRNHPDEAATSGLSPYLHFGHIGAHEVFAAIAASQRWTSARLTAPSTGARAGWWRMSPEAEAFVDQLVTWRELGFNNCAHRADHGTFESLPAWARGTLDKHEQDPRSVTYSLDQLQRADTHDRLWNAAQTELTRDGRIHNYLRMVWGKRILEWSPTARDALSHMLELNDRFALDGRDPNSLSGILWILGQHDRAWGPERPIFGTVRYMSSANTMRKLRLRDYMARYATTADRPPTIATPTIATPAGPLGIETTS